MNIDKQELRAIAGAGGGGCFRKGTPVQLQHGKTIPIEQLKVGDEILSFDEKGAIHLAKVTKTHYHADPQPVLRVKYWGGEVEVTPNHWVLNEYNAFSEVGRLTIHDCLVDGMGHLRPIIEATLVGHEPVYNLTVEPHHTFIAGGVRVHNGGHRDLYPTIAGSGGGGGKSSQGRAPVEDPDSLQSRTMLAVIDLLGEGQIGGLVDGAKSIFLNDTPMEASDGTMNFQGVTWDQRVGEPGQRPLAEGFGTVETPVPLSVQFKKDMPAIFTISNPNADAVRIAVALPSLMTQDTDDGDIHGTTVQFRFEMSLNSGMFFNASGDLAISGKTRSRYQRAYQLQLPKTTSGGAPVTLWTIRAVRITADATSAGLSNETYLDSYSEVVNSRLSYPLSAYVGIRIDSAQFNSIPTRAYLVDGLLIRVPNNYDPATNTYNGIWDGGFKLSVSSNPAWILYDLLTSVRYGLGQYISEDMVDEARLYQIGRYCDELVPDGFGGMEPRFRINTAIQTRVEAFTLIRDVCSAFNGMAYWTGSQIGFTQDAPSDPVMVFTPANVVDGMFNYSGSSRKDRHSVVNVVWTDPAQNYKQVVEYVEDAELIQKFGVRKMDTIAFGCDSRGQANRVGRWILYTERYQSEIVSFEVGLDSMLVMPGEVVKIHDTQRAGKRVGGRLKSATLTTAVLDFPVDVQSGSTISIRMPDGKFVERTLHGSGTMSQVTWGQPLPALPVANAIWLISHLSLEPMLARVVGVAQTQNPATVAVTCVAHNASKYDAIEKDMPLLTPNTSVLDYKTVATPESMTVMEAPYQVAPGVLGLTLEVSWSGEASSYEVRWRRLGMYETSWAVISSTTPNVRLENIRSGEYLFEVTAVNAFGARSGKLMGKYTPVGRTSAPGDVLGFKVTKRTNDLQITWDPVAEFDLLGYEVRVGESWDSGEVIITNFAGTMLTHDQTEAGTYKYHIRSMGRSGMYSESVSTAVVVLSAPDTVRGFDIVRHGNGARLELTWEPNRETDLVHYEIREGKTWAASSVLARVKATSFTTPAGSVGNRTFWIKAVTAPGIYAEQAAWAGAQVAVANTSNLILESNQRDLGWSGYRVNMDELGSGLIMSPGATRAEYAFPIEIGGAYSCQNSFNASVEAVAVNTTDWTSATFTWASQEASRSWLIQGDVDSITSKKQIATYTGQLNAGEYDAWRLDGALTSVSGRAPSAVSGVKFERVRYGNGVILSGGAKIGWQNLALPETFAIQFWLKPKMGAGSVTQSIMELASAKGFLRLSYNGETKEMVLEDDADGAVRTFVGERGIDPSDLLCVSIAQTSTERSLGVIVVGKSDGDTASVNVAPIGQIQALRLHWSNS